MKCLVFMDKNKELWDSESEKALFPCCAALRVHAHGVMCWHWYEQINLFYINLIYFYVVTAPLCV